MQEVTNDLFDDVDLFAKFVVRVDRELGRISEVETSEKRKVEIGINERGYSVFVDGFEGLRILDFEVGEGREKDSPSFVRKATSGSIRR